MLLNPLLNSSFPFELLFLGYEFIDTYIGNNIIEHQDPLWNMTFSLVCVEHFSVNFHLGENGRIANSEQTRTVLLQYIRVMTTSNFSHPMSDITLIIDTARDHRMHMFKVKIIMMILT